MRVPSLLEIPVQGKRLLIREDLNAPIAKGKVSSDARLVAALPTIKYAIEQGAKSIVVASHLGRPPSGATSKTAPEFSMRPIASRLSELLGREVALLDSLDEAARLPPGTLALLENLRFFPGETENDHGLAKRLAKLCDVFVMDAFASAHRAHASTAGVIDAADIACAGPLLARELEALESILENPARPLVSIVGGAKISSKLGVLDRLAQLSDKLVVGGAIANTFLAAANYEVGKSLIEASMLGEAQRLLAKYDPLLPEDVVTARELGADARTSICPVDSIPADEMVVDVGPASRSRLHDLLLDAGTILWNGPLGVFEIDAFAAGTLHLSHSVAESPAFSLAGGGDTLAAIDLAQVRDSISYISTGGGALLEFVEGKELPSIALLRARAR